MDSHSATTKTYGKLIVMYGNLRSAFPQWAVTCRLLPDRRVLSIDKTIVEVYPPPDTPWEEQFSLPPDLPVTKPVWVYYYTPSPRNLPPTTSRLFHSRTGGWVRLSIHNGQTLFDVRICLANGAEPDVRSTPLPQAEWYSKIGLGTARATLSTAYKREVTLVTFGYRPGMRELKAFVGAASAITSEEELAVDLDNILLLPSPPGPDHWRIDEESGRAVALKDEKYTVFSFTD